MTETYKILELFTAPHLEAIAWSTQTREAIQKVADHFLYHDDSPIVHEAALNILAREGFYRGTVQRVAQDLRFSETVRAIATEILEEIQLCANT